jgi:hypothetical protein
VRANRFVRAYSVVLVQKKYGMVFLKFATTLCC